MNPIVFYVRRASGGDTRPAHPHEPAGRPFGDRSGAAVMQRLLGRTKRPISPIPNVPHENGYTPSQHPRVSGFSTYDVPPQTRGNVERTPSSPTGDP